MSRALHRPEQDFPLSAGRMVTAHLVRAKVLTMTYTVKGAWEGWKGETLVEMTDGSIWKQVEYHYEYRYAFQPKAQVVSGKMQVSGMSRAVRVRRVQ